MRRTETIEQSSEAGRLTLLLSGEAAAIIRAEAFAGFENPQKAGPEVGGILTKSFRGDSISMVDGVELTRCEHLYGRIYRLSPSDMHILRQRVRHLRAFGTQNVVGLFRSSTRESFSAAPEDIAVVREIIGETAPIFIAQPAAEGKCALRVFWPGDDQSWSQFEEFQLPDTPVSKRVEETDSPATPRADYSPEQSGVSIAPSHGAAPSLYSKAIVWRETLAKGNKLGWWIPGVIAACLVGFYLRPVRENKELRAPAPDLNLQTEVQRDSLRLTWNRNLPAVQNAIAGKLQIDDGPAHRDIDLDSNQVSHGAVIYIPASDDVTFRLQIRGRGAEQTFGTVRVLSGTKREFPESALNTNPIPPVFIPEPPVTTSARNQKTPSSQHPAQPSPQKVERAANVQPTPVQQPNGTESPLPPPVPEASAASVIPQPPKQIEVERAQAPGVQPTPASPNATSPNATGPSRVDPIATGAPVPPHPVKQVVPAMGSFGAPAVLSRMTIAVQIKIDQSGNVIEAHALPGSNSLYWASKAVEAAKQWRFEPAKLHGQSVASDYTITFNFGPPRAGY